MPQEQSTLQASSELTDIVHPLDPSWLALEHHTTSSSARALGDIGSFQPQPVQLPLPPPSPPLQPLPPRQPTPPPPPQQSLNWIFADDLSAANTVAGVGIPKTRKAPQRNKPMPKPSGEPQQQIEPPPGLGFNGSFCAGITSLGAL